MLLLAFLYREKEKDDCSAMPKKNSKTHKFTNTGTSSVGEGSAVVVQCTPWVRASSVCTPWVCACSEGWCQKLRCLTWSACPPWVCNSSAGDTQSLCCVASEAKKCDSAGTPVWQSDFVLCDVAVVSKNPPARGKSPRQENGKGNKKGWSIDGDRNKKRKKWVINVNEDCVAIVM